MGRITEGGVHHEDEAYARGIFLSATLLRHVSWVR